MLKEEGKHHNFFGIGCYDVLTYSTSPLEHGLIWEKMIFDQLVNPVLICNGSLEEVWVRGIHGGRRKA
jgi:hypothetical protein